MTATTYIIPYCLLTMTFIKALILVNKVGQKRVYKCLGVFSSFSQKSFDRQANHATS